MNLVKNSVCALIFSSVLTGAAFANQTIMKDSLVPPATGKFYVGIFGGGGSPNQVSVNQYGTAYYAEAAGGPLAVNAFGSVNAGSTWLLGAQAGYQAPDIFITPQSQLTLAPAGELEWYYFGRKSYTGDVFNNTARLPEHDFYVTYPVNNDIFLANAVLNFNKPGLIVHPYIGVGIGGAIVNISHATAIQTAPAEPGINHYNANTNDTAPAFAGQIKAGLSYDFNDYISVFAEYRWLYLSTTHFTFGSTVYPGHVETAPWLVTLNSQRYNIGTVGVRVNV